MATLTIPKNLTRGEDLLVIRRKEYEALLVTKKFGEFKPTVAQKKALVQAEKNLAAGKTLSYNDLTSKLGFAKRN